MVKAAYEVLSDPGKRSTYDQVRVSCVAGLVSCRAGDKVKRQMYRRLALCSAI